jgi:hypothetical protein
MSVKNRTRVRCPALPWTGKRKREGGVPFSAAQGPRPGRDAPAMRARLARGGDKRHHAFLAALAAHQQHARIAPERRNGQAHKLAHPQPRGIEQFDQAGVAQPLARVPAMGGRRPAGGLPPPRSGHRAAPCAPSRPLDLKHGLSSRQPVFMGEAIELLERRQPPRAGGGRHVGRLQLGQVGLDRGPVGPGETARRAARARPSRPSGRGHRREACSARPPVRRPAPPERPRSSRCRCRAAMAQALSSRSCSAARLAISSNPTARSRIRASAMSPGSPSRSLSTRAARRNASPIRSLSRNHA